MDKFKTLSKEEFHDLLSIKVMIRLIVLAKTFYELDDEIPNVNLRFAQAKLNSIEI